jgi:hypothetical protein
MQIIPIYDTAANADQSFRNDIQAAINIFDAAIVSPITVRLDIEKGEYRGQDIASMVINGIHLTQNYSLGYINDGPTPISYATLRGDLINSVPNLFNATNLPNTSGVNGHSSFSISSSEERLFGIADARLSSSTFIDGYVGIGTSFAAGNVRISAALHEIGHALGRVENTELDLFRFTSPGNRLFGSVQPVAPPAYFSLDGGANRIANWGQQSDQADFLNDNLTVNDPFDEIVGSLNNLTTKDLQVMAALGFRVAAPIFGNDNPASVQSGGTVFISRSSLSVTSPTNVFADNELTYTIVTAPSNGTLLKGGSATSSFTQDDIDNNRIAYHETASNVSSDFFLFYVSDPAGNRTANAPFQFQISTPRDTTAPLLIRANPLSVLVGATATISASSNLAFSDPDDFDSQLTYTIVIGPTNGTLLKNSSPTSSFTQADLDNGLITYHETASNVSSDSFTFSVSDLAGNSTGGQFQFQISTIAPLRIEPAVGDFNGDGSSDFIMYQDAGTIRTLYDFEMQNSQVANSHLIGRVGTDWQFAGVGDFNRDGSSDFIMYQDAGTIRTLYDFEMRNGQVVNPHLIGRIGTDWQFAGVGDFNRDGSSDFIMFQDAGRTRTLYDFEMQNGQVVNPHLIGRIGIDWQFAGVGDFNRDGNSDFIMYQDAGTIKILYDFEMQNGQVVNPHLIGRIGTDWQFAGVGDFNNDSNSDFIMYQDVGAIRTLYDFEMRNGQVVNPHLIGRIGTDWQFAGVGDFNRDGTSDFVMAQTNGAILVFEVHGGQVTAAHVLQSGQFARSQNEASTGDGVGAYDVAQNQITTALPSGVDTDAVGPVNSGLSSISRLAQAMAGFGGGSGAADGSGAGLDAEASQQTFLTTPQHA